MLTDEDIKKLSAVLATKEDVADLHQNLEGLRESVQALVLAVDGLTKAVNDLRQEYAAIGNKIDRHEKWIHQIADKLGVELKY